MDLFDKINIDETPLGQHYKYSFGYFMFPRLEGEIKPRMQFNGKEVLTWSLNNYIGLANHPEVRKADGESAVEFGLATPMGARMMSGQTEKHEELEQSLAKFVGKEACFLLNFGYQGMVSIIDSLVDRNDVIVYDSESHACILDGMRLHIGKRFVYPHNNIENLEKQLERATKLVESTNGAILVITEGVFGMAGDLGKLDEIVALKKKYNFRLLVDDAHGFGTMGETGAGTGEHFGVQEEIDLYFSTFAKAMAGFGGFIASTKKVIDYIVPNLRSQVFAKSLPMPMVIGGLKRLELLQKEKGLRENLWKIVHALQKGLKDNGFDIGVTESPVTPVYMQGNVTEALNLVHDLREEYGVFTSCIVYPVIPKGQILLRLIPTAAHTLEDVDQTIKAFSAVAKKQKAGEYSSEVLPTPHWDGLPS